MNCPVCGAKLYNNNVCKYCKDVTRTRIENASNIKAKEAFKSKDESLKQQVVYSTYIPSDVNKVKLVLLTILLGWLGIHNYYIGRLYKGLFSTLSISIEFCIQALKLANEYYSWGVASSLSIFDTIFAFMGAFVVIIWFGDVMALLVKKFKVPVILPPVETPKPAKTSK